MGSMNRLQDVWVFAEQSEALAILCAGARSLGEKVSVLVVGPRSEAEEAIKMGADRVYWLGAMDAGRMLEDYTIIIYNLICEKKPNLFLVASSKRGKLIAGRIAARLRTSVLTDVLEFVVKGNQLQVRRMVYGGTAIRTEQSNSKIVIATVAKGALNGTSSDEYRHQGEIEDVVFVEAPQRIKCTGKHSTSGVPVNLEAAKRIVSVGDGLAEKKDLEMIESFADLIGAEMGCSRPIGEVRKWMPKQRIVGMSGNMVKPKIYIAIGISGAIQHMAGCNQADKIFAINSNRDADIFKHCDYGLVGDLYKSIPTMIEMIKDGK